MYVRACSKGSKIEKICKALGKSSVRNANLLILATCTGARPVYSPQSDRNCNPRRAMPLSVPLQTILLLLASNVFMTFAWYGHLKYRSAPLITVILISWGIAFFEYLLQVPANRIGHEVFSAAQLKTIQEVITLSVFAAFSVFYLKEPLTWNHALGFTLIAAGAAVIFHRPF